MKKSTPPHIFADPDRRAMETAYRNNAQAAVRALARAMETDIVDAALSLIYPTHYVYDSTQQGSVRADGLRIEVKYKLRPRPQEVVEDGPKP